MGPFFVVTSFKKSLCLIIFLFLTDYKANLSLLLLIWHGADGSKAGSLDLKWASLTLELKLQIIHLSKLLMIILHIGPFFQTISVFVCLF